MITDGQIHLWDDEGRGGQSWAAGTKPDLEKAMTGARFAALMDEVGVARAIITPPGIYGFDCSHAIRCAEEYSRRFAVVIRWTLDDEAGWARLPDLCEQPHVLGIRLALTSQNLASWRPAGRLDRFFAQAAALRIPLMLFTNGDLSAVEDAARNHPHLRLVVDHANLVGAMPETISARIDALEDLARYANVGVKLSALPLRSSGLYPFADLHAPIDRIYRLFGSSRLMWASDLTTTLAQRKGSYADSLDLIRIAALRHIPDAEMEDILGRTVSTWFDWPSR